MAETFASAFAGVRQYEPRDTPAVAWLFTIARNLLTDARRRGQVRASARRRLGLERLWLDDADIAKIESLAGAPEVDALLGGLSVDERTAIQARILEERSYPDIAAELRCSENVADSPVFVLSSRSTHERLPDAAIRVTWFDSSGRAVRTIDQEKR
jgi:RNA polymerase sigma factor (sigma-70 family)